MKRLTSLLSVVCILLYAPVHAQWVSGNPTTTTNKVVIGTNPSTTDLLSIQGTGFWQLRLKDDLGGNEWRIGSSGSDWNAGGGKLLFSPATASTSSVLSLLPTGKVGINNVSPAAALDQGVSAANTLTTVFGRLVEGNGSGTGTFLGAKVYSTGAVNVKSFAIEHTFYGVVNSSVSFYRGADAYDGFMTFNTNNNTERMRIATNGNVSIGTTTSNGYKLAVNGTIGAREVNVNTATWSDYVFNSDYHLLPLTDLEKYIAANHHLPEVPSTAEVEKNGINVGEMNALLLKKIEELTLHIIDQEKRIKQLESQR